VKTLRVVLDTNTLVSALLFRRDNWSWLRSAWKEGPIAPVLCSATTLELIKVLSYPKFNLSRVEQEGFLQEILPYCETRPNPQLVIGLSPCRDPKDQVFLELALESHADYLVSGDKDIQAYPPVEGLRIINAASLRMVVEH
jgi:putative PIN family toxin of toxin-antitoxin system